MLVLFLTTVYLCGLVTIGLLSRNKVETITSYAVGESNYSSIKTVTNIIPTILSLAILLEINTQYHSIGFVFITVILFLSCNKFLVAKLLVNKIYDHRNNLTIGGLMSSFYGKAGRTTTGCIVFIHSAMIYAVYISGIIYSFEYIIKSGSSISVIFVLGSMIAYTAFGGIKAIINTNILQCFILIIAISTTFTIGVILIDSYDFFGVLPVFEFKNLLNTLEDKSWLLPISLLCLSNFEPLTIQSIFNCRGRQQATDMLYITGFIFILFLIISSINGLLTILLLPSSNLCTAVAMLVDILLPTELRSIIIIGILATMIPTANLQLHTAAHSMVHDIIIPFSKTRYNDQAKLKYSRISVVLIGLAISSYVLFNYNIQIKVIYYAYKIWFSTIIIPLIAGLYGTKISRRAYLLVFFSGFSAMIYTDYISGDYYNVANIYLSLIIQIILIILAGYSVKYTYLKKILTNFTIDLIRQQKILLSQIYFVLYKLVTESIINKLIEFSASRVRLHGAYYLTFGIFGITNYIIPYFIWTHEIINDYVTLILRITSSTLCFMLILRYQSENLEDTSSHLKTKNLTTLPLFWHCTLLFCLPVMSTYTLLFSGFATTWLVNSTLAIFVLVLLVDWLTFSIILPLGFVLGYLIYICRTGHLGIYYIKENLYLTIYLNCFAILIGAFFLYHKEKMIKAVVEAKNHLEIMNAQLEEKVQKRTDILKQALNIKTEFLNNISHEVRTPLQGITGISTELVEQWDKLNDQQRFDYVKTVANNSNRLISLVSNLLDLSKFDSGKMLFDIENKNLTTVVSEVVDELNLFNTKTNISIKLLPVTVDTQTLFDRLRIAQVVRNLLSNAIKFTDNDIITVTINHTDIKNWYKIAENGIEVKITDNGPGIPANELKSIFKPFTQSSRTKTKAGGTGLGLAICTEIITAHDGRIWAENNKNGRGASFIFIIPLIRNTYAVSTNARLKNIKPNILPTIVANTKVLLIDDEQSCLLAGSLILQSAGFIVITAEGGEEALRLLQEHNFCVIFLDLMMPDIYGLDVLYFLKNNPLYENIPVILQTGASDNNEIAKAFILGIAGYISKPYDKEHMIKLVSKVLKETYG